MASTIDKKPIAIVYDVHVYGTAPTSFRKDDYFETCLRKLEEILKENEIIIFLGDLFEKAIVPDIIKNRLLQLFNRYNREMYITLGNHDIQNDNLETFLKTSVGNLSYHKCITILKDPDIVYNIGGWKVRTLPFHIEDAKKFVAKEKTDLVVGHHFYNWNLDLSQSIEEHEVSQYACSVLCLGHDHEPHPVVINGETKIFRCGSTLRTAMNEYTKTHEPKYLRLTSDGIFEIPITAEKFENVFKVEEKFLFKKKLKRLVDIKKLIQTTNIDPVRTSKTIRDILVEDLKAPVEVLDFLKLVHRVNNKEF